MPSALSDVAKRHSLMIFYVLACALSWSYSLFTPHGIFPFGPLLAALIMTALVDGKRGLRDFLGRILRWKVGFRWYLPVFALPLVVTLAAFGLALAMGATPTDTESIPNPPSLVIRFLFIFVFIGLGEEPAWRGYALPRLLEGRSALAASFLLAPLHIFWHLPLFGLEYDLANGVPWALAVTAFTVLTTWLYKGASGSLLMPALFHTCVNTLAFSHRFFSGADRLLHWWLYGGLWAAAAVGVIVWAGPNLSGRRQ